MSDEQYPSLSDSLSIHEPQKSAAVDKAHNQKFRTYVSGYVLSIFLTISAYLLVVHQTETDYWFVITMITLLAFAQFLVQIVFFLHISTDRRQRWKLLVLIFMIIVVSILVLGSVWIMNNLNYRMTPQQVNTYMQDQDSL